MLLYVTTTMQQDPHYHQHLPYLGSTFLLYCFSPRKNLTQKQNPKWFLMDLEKKVQALLSGPLEHGVDKKTGKSRNLY